MVSAIFFAAGFTLASQSPSIPALATILQADPAEIGGMFSTFSIGIIAVQFLLTPLSRRVGMRNTLLLCVLLMGLSFILIGQGINLTILFTAALLSGFGFGGILSLGNRLVAALFPRGSAAALNGVNVFFSVGSILGPVLASMLSKQFNAPQYALGIGGLLMCCFALLMPFTVPNIREQEASTQPSQQTEGAPPTFNTWLVSLMLLLYIGAEIGFSAWITLYMINSAAMADANAALVTASFWVALTAGRILATLLGLRLSTQQLLLLSISGLVLSSIVLISSVGNIPFSVLGVLLFGLSCGPVFPTGIALVASNSRATAQVMVIANCGGLILPALFGFVLTYQGPLMMQLLVGLTTLTMLVVGIITMRPAKRLSQSLSHD